MPTNDERREAVRFLRTAICTESDCDTCREMSAKLFPPSDDSCFDGHSTLCRLDNEGDGAIWRRLADLIEPEERRCRMVLDEDATSLLEYDDVLMCTACGEEVVRKTGTTVRFCPNCGAKVTEADS